MAALVSNCSYLLSSVLPVQAFAVIAVLFLAVFSYFVVKDYNASKPVLVGLALMCIGGLWNLYERVFIGSGCVNDYFDFFGWFVFNTADLLFTLGFLVLLKSILFAKPVTQVDQESDE